MEKQDGRGAVPTARRVGRGDTEPVLGFQQQVLGGKYGRCHPGPLSRDHQRSKGPQHGAAEQNGNEEGCEEEPHLAGNGRPAENKHQQLKKLNSLVELVHEDLKFDYKKQLDQLQR